MAIEGAAIGIDVSIILITLTECAGCTPDQKASALPLPMQDTADWPYNHVRHEHEILIFLYIKHAILAEPEIRLPKIG
jgi:hypothetical protein